MKKMSAEKVLEYYIKLAKKETKVKKVYIQRKDATIYFSNGEFICSFATFRENMIDFLQETFNFTAGNDNFCVECLGDYCVKSERTIAEFMPTTLESDSLYYTGISAEDTRRTVCAFTDGEKLFAYDEKYVKPIRWSTFGKALLRNTNFIMCMYLNLDVSIAILPINDHSQFAKFAKLKM